MFDDPATLSQRLTVVQVKAHKMPESSYIRFTVDSKKKRGLLSHKGGVEVYNLSKNEPILVKTLSKIWAHSVICSKQYIILQEYKTNNLEIYADDELIKTYKGEPADHSQYRLYLNVKSTSSSKKVLWISGENSISIINLKNLKESRINDFFTYADRFGSEIGKPVCIFRMLKPDIVIGLIVFKNKEFCMNCIYITEKYQEWLSVKQFLDDVSFVSSVEISSTPSIFYMLSQHGPLENSKSKLNAVKIENGQLTVISSVVINNNGFKQGYSLKVHQVVKERVDYIVCGGDGQIALCVFKANNINILRCFENLHKSAVIDIGIIGNKIFTVGLDDTKINHIFVPSELSQSSMLINQSVLPNEADPENVKKKKVKFKKYINEKIQVLGRKDLCKIDVDSKGEKLYVGGNGITVLSTDPKSTEDSLSRAKDLKISWFKVFEDKIIVQQSETYALLVFDLNFSQTKKFKGTPGPCPDNESLRNCRFCNDDKISLWMMGEGSLGVVNPKDLSQSSIKGFFGDKDKSLPISAVSNKDGKIVMGLSAIGFDMKLCFYQKGKKPKLSGAKEKLKEFGSFLSLEVDKKDSIVFVGGSTEYEFTEGEAIIAAIQFSDKMTFIAQLKLDDEDNKIVASIRRINKSNILAAGTSTNVYMLKFEKSNKFKKLCCVKNIHSGVDPICGLVFDNEVLYTCAPGDDFVQKVTFTE